MSDVKPESEGIPGPHLQFAVLCERVLQESDGTLSLIRIVDRINVAVQAIGPSGATSSLPPLAPFVPLTLAISFKSGDATTTRQLGVRIQTPSGFRLPDYSASVAFEGGDRGVNVILPMQFPAQDDGLYWFEIELDGNPVTRVPLRVVKQTVTQTIPPQLPG